MFASFASSAPFLPAEPSRPVLDEYTAMILTLAQPVPLPLQSASPSLSFTDNDHLTEDFRQPTSPPYLPAYYPPHAQPVFLPFQPNPSPMVPSLSMSLLPPSPALSSVAPPSPSNRSASSKRFYVCEKCPKDYSSKRSLNRHVNSIHKLTKFTCDVCHQTLCRKDVLIRHKRDSKQCKAILELQEKIQLCVKAPLPHITMNSSKNDDSSSNPSGRASAGRQKRGVGRYMPYPSLPSL